ncbi:hypothetical protein LCGC14_2726670 [marine sediment metagenome]|uniref:Uncharacterized protein n=1 Tax=marine sediment metagenome TaxID=412755 RepID=A0A0F9C078_9ZZZZ
MDLLIWTGAVLSLVGIGGLAWCIRQAFVLRRSNLEEDMMRTRLQRLVAWNLGALLLSAFGLMMVVVGIFLA